MAEAALKPLKAYSVLENDEGTGSIYFARHRIEAHKWGANEHGDGELRYCTCRRTPWADRYAETRSIPAREAVAHGWWFECSACGAKVSESELYDRRLTVDGVIGSMFGLVFCDKRCAAHYLSITRRRKAFEAREVEKVRDIVRRRFGDVQFRDEKFDTHVYATPNLGGFHTGQVIVSFEFPGMKIGAASFRVDWPMGVRIGQLEGGYTCCNGDREAFEAWARETREAARG